MKNNGFPARIGERLVIAEFECWGESGDTHAVTVYNPEHALGECFKSILDRTEDSKTVTIRVIHELIDIYRYKQTQEVLDNAK